MSYIQKQRTMKKKISILAIAAVAALAFVSCSKEKEEGTAPLQGISIAPDSTSVKVGSPLTLKVVYNPKNAAEKPQAVWSCSDTTLAVVANGKVTSKRAGEVVITATAGEFSANCKVTIENDVPIEGTSNVSLVGTFLGNGEDGWDMDYMLAEVKSGVYVIRHVTLTEYDKFKIRFDKSWDLNRGGTFVELGKGFAVVEDGVNIRPYLNGTFDIWYNKEKEQMAVTVKDGTPAWN